MKKLNNGSSPVVFVCFWIFSIALSMATIAWELDFLTKIILLLLSFVFARVAIRQTTRPLHQWGTS